RNIWRAYVNRGMSDADESRMAKNLSLVVKFGALVAVLFLPTKFAIDLQLLGGIWVLQIFPAVICGLFTRWLRPGPLLLGWAVGMVVGTVLPVLGGLSPVYSFTAGGSHIGIYTGLLALAINLAVAVAATLVAAAFGRGEQMDRTRASDYEDGVSAGGSTVRQSRYSHR